MTVRRIGVLIAAALTLTAAACGTDNTPSDTAAPAASSTSNAPQSTDVSAPAAESSAGSATVDAVHNDADITFAQMMIVHHEGAVEMADLAPDRAASAKVKDLAVKIKVAQAPEIEQMTQWLQAWGAATSGSSSESSSMGGMDHSGMSEGSGDHADMPGMMSDEQMKELTDATGAEFDTMFLQLMIAHHQGALDMAETEKSEGKNPQALDLADSIISSQTAEIAEMEDLLQTS